MMKRLLSRVSYTAVKYDCTFAALGANALHVKQMISLTNWKAPVSRCLCNVQRSWIHLAHFV